MGTQLADLTDQIQKQYGAIILDDVKAETPVLGLLDRKYQGEIKEKGNTVQISVLQDLNGETKKTNARGAAEFTAQGASFKTLNITADNVTYVPVEFDSLAALQSQLNDLVGVNKEETRAKLGSSKIYLAIKDAIRRAMEKEVYALIKRTSGLADEEVATFDLNAAKTIRKKIGKAKWGTVENKIALLSSGYFTDLITDKTLASEEYTDKGLMVGDVKATKRLGVNFFEDETDDLAAIKDQGEGGVVFRQDAFNLVIQQEPEFDIVDNKSAGRDTYTIFSKIVWGVNLGYNANKKFFKIAPAGA